MIDQLIHSFNIECLHYPGGCNQQRPTLQYASELSLKLTHECIPDSTCSYTPLIIDDGNGRPYLLLNLRPHHVNVIFNIENHFSLAKHPVLSPPVPSMI